MHVIQIITELEEAGAEKILLELSIGLKNKNYKVSVISLQKIPENSFIVNTLKANNIEIFSLNLSKFTFWKIFFLKHLILTLIKNDNPQEVIIHSHLMHANLACRISKLMKLKLNLINTIHTAEKRSSQKWLFYLDKLTLRYCDAYTAVSHAARDYHAQILKIDKNRISVIYNGILFPEVLTSEKIASLKKEWGFLTCSKIIGSLGRLNKQKGYDIFFDLIFELSKAIPENEIWGIVILGEGQERKKLEKQIQSSPNNIKILLPGFRNDAPQCIGAFNLFVMPSRYEGFGLVLLEAMSQCVPILASSVDSLPELISNYPNGKCINFENKENAIPAILEWINREKLLSFKPDFSQEKMVSEYASLYEKLEVVMK